jgi:hypothetical protein
MVPTEFNSDVDMGWWHHQSLGHLKTSTCQYLHIPFKQKKTIKIEQVVKTTRLGYATCVRPQHVGCPTENVVFIGGILVLGTTRSNLGDNMKNNGESRRHWGEGGTMDYVIGMTKRAMTTAGKIARLTFGPP